jgi:hypothetical protein
MRKDILLPALSLTGGAAGFFLRRWQLTSAYRPEEGLFSHGSPATLALLGLIGMLAVIFLLLIWDKGETPEDFLPAFRCPEEGQMALLASAGLLLMAAGALGLWSGLRALQQWRLAPVEYQLSTLSAQLLAAALCLPAGLAILLLGRMTYREELNTAACRLASLPAFAGLVWLFSCHLRHGIEPVLMKYGFTLAAALLLTLAHYYIAGFLFDRPCLRRTAFLALMGPVLGLVSLADRPDLFSAVAAIALSLSALAFARALLRATFGPPWPKRLEGRMPPPAEEEPEK